MLLLAAHFHTQFGELELRGCAFARNGEGTIDRRFLVAFSFAVHFRRGFRKEEEPA